MARNRTTRRFSCWLVVLGLILGLGLAGEASEKRAMAPQSRIDPRGGYLRKLYGPLSSPAKGEPRAIARRFLKEYGHLFRMKDDPDDLQLYWERKSPGGRHVRFQQMYQGLPVYGGYASVHLDKAGRVELVHNGYRPDLKGPLAGERVSRETAIALARKELGVRERLRGEVIATHVVYPLNRHGQPELADPKHENRFLESPDIFTVKDQPHLAWQVAIPARRPLGDWLVLVDAESGETLEVRNLMQFAEGAGRVFDPNPVVTLENRTLRDNNDSATAVPEAAYIPVILRDISRDLDGSFFLRGPFVDTTLTPNSVHEPGLTFEYNRSQPGFEEVMAYYHIDRYQRYIQETLGFTDIHNRPQKVNARAVIDLDGIPGPDPDQDNSFYSPLTGELFFGLGGVDDAEDADVILHEYGHALQDDVAPDFGQGREYDEAAAMSEGFSDYMAAGFFADHDFDDISNGCIGDWDTRDNLPVFPCLRQVVNDKRYPGSLTGWDVHRDGEIWSGALWDLRHALIQELGAEERGVMADRLVFQSLYLLEPEDDFRAGAAAILQADRLLHPPKGAYQDLIVAVFEGRGIEMPLVLDPDPWEENDSFAAASPIDLPFDQAGLTIDAPGDDDFYRFRLEQAGVVTIDLEFVGSAGDLNLSLLDSEENILAASESELSDRESITAGLAPGEYVVRVMGFEKATNSYRLQIVSTPWSLAINEGAEYTTRSKVTLNLTALGAARVRLRNEEGRWSRWFKVSASRSWSLSGGQGEKRVWAEFEDDDARLVGPLSASIVLDSKKPVGGILIDKQGKKRRGVLINDGQGVMPKGTPDTWVRLTLLAEDGGSGVDRMLLSNSPRFEGAVWEDYAPEKNWVLEPGEGKRSVYVRYRDRAGNISARYAANIKVTGE